MNAPVVSEAHLPEDKGAHEDTGHGGVCPGVSVQLMGGKLAVALNIHHLQCSMSLSVSVGLSSMSPPATPCMLDSSLGSESARDGTRTGTGLGYPLIHAIPCGLMLL